MRKHLLYRLAKHSAAAVPPSTTSHKGDAVGKINALNSAHEIIPKSTSSVKKNSDIFSFRFISTRCCGEMTHVSQHHRFFRKAWRNCGKNFGYNINKELPFSYFFAIMYAKPQCPRIPFPGALPTGALTLCVKSLGAQSGERLFAPMGQGGTALPLCRNVHRPPTPIRTHHPAAYGGLMFFRTGCGRLKYSLVLLEEAKP